MSMARLKVRILIILHYMSLARPFMFLFFSGEEINILREPIIRTNGNDLVLYQRGRFLDL